MGEVFKKVMDVARRQSVFQIGDVDGVGDPRSTLCRMVAKGNLIRVSRGFYALPEAEVGVDHSLVEVTKCFPGGVICLISALCYHRIGTQMPYETWVMRGDRRVVSRDGLPVRFVYSSGGAFTFGVKTHLIEGVEVCVYSPAKTVADCFKYRNKTGLDIALEALREGWKGGHFTMDEIWKAARVCRVQRVMQPYLEMLVQ